jgi:UDP-N-acetylmuramate dehydrogenase
MLLSELTTIRVGGPASDLVEPTTESGLVDAAVTAWAAGEDWLILGGGSNLVVADEGFEGTVIRVATRGIESSVEGSTVRLRVQAGEPWDAVVAHAVSNGWAGIEALSGIPGSSGAAPVQNIGAYGQELADTLAAIDFLEYGSDSPVRIPATELGLGYRTSALKEGRLGVVVAIELLLTVSREAPAAHDQLAAALGVPVGERLPLDRIRESVLALRAAKGMLLDPADPDSVSCGSFFTNPIVSGAFARGLPAGVPQWPVEPEPHDIVVQLGEAAPVEAPPFGSDSRVKLSAAWLIEHSGISKGFALPGSGAAISSKHTLAIVNTGAATADDVASLARFIQARVLAEFGVLLVPEPTGVGIQL